LNNSTNRIILTAHPEFTHAAVAELKQLDKDLTTVEELSPGIVLCEAGDAAALMRRAAGEHPTFVRHLAPVQAEVRLENTAQDIGNIAMEMAALPTVVQIERGTRFAVQSRFVQSDKSRGERAYSSGQLNQALAEAFVEETGAIESIKKPRVVASILCTLHTAYMGISTAEENLSTWPGGARHFAQLPEGISRAEFKLLEALEVFDITLPQGKRVLDLGAAPGGWTRLLLDAGIHVIAVDPALLDPRVAERPHLDHYRGYAEDFLDEAVRRRISFDAIVNDMRMDARDAARLLAQAAQCLRKDGFVISVLKLPHATEEINPLRTLRDALQTLNRHYGVVQARQLFHNRQEVTVVAAQPLPTRT
jgi:23S rRNA (cytidine2498-2'-O)-methyltransferase